jgi:hypothetical protein
MPFSRSDLVEVLRHLQVTLAEVDPVLAEEIGALRVQSNDPRSTVLQYLERLSSAVAARSAGAGTEALINLNRFVATETGRPIDDIKLVTAEVDAERFGSAETSLTYRPDYESVISELREVARLLHEEDREA